MTSSLSSTRRSTVRVTGIAAVIGAVTSPFLAVYTVVLGVPAALLAWAVGGRAGEDPARLVGAAAVGVAVGASLYFALAVVVSIAG